MRAALRARETSSAPTTPRASTSRQPDDQLGAFQRVSRTYEGREYVLQSGAIERFGEWPTLPAGIRTPTGDDGSPSFAQVGTDAGGVAVYASRGSSAERRHRDRPERAGGRSARRCTFVELVDALTGSLGARG